MLSNFLQISPKMYKHFNTNVEIFLLSIYKTTLAANQNNMATPQTYDSQQMAHMLSLPQPHFKIIKVHSQYTYKD